MAEYDYMDFGIKLIVFALLYALFALICQICLAVTVNYDCKSKNNSKATMWSVLVFFFPYIAGIIYLCTRNDAKHMHPKRCMTCGAMIDVRYDFCPQCSGTAFDQQLSYNPEVYKKKAKTSVIVTVITFIAAIVMAVLMIAQIFSVGFDSLKKETDPYGSHFAYSAEDGSKCFYDMKGNVYTDSDDVKYYDRDGNVYRYDDEEDVFADYNGEIYYTYFTYVDSDGYFVYDEDNKIYTDDVDGSYIDDEGNVYFYAPNVSWNSEGKLVDSSSGTQLN